VEYSAQASLDYVEQSSYDLSLYLVRGTRLSRPLRTLATREIAGGSFRAKITVIGASHTITFTTSGGAWREILACLPVPPVHGTPVVSQKRFRKQSQLGATEFSHSDAGMHYQFLARWMPLSNALYETARKRSTGPDSLLVSFPGPSAIPPFTGVTWRSHRGGIAVDSVHAYPGEKQAVLARSVFTTDPNGLPSLEEAPFTLADGNELSGTYSKTREKRGRGE